MSETTLQAMTWLVPASPLLAFFLILLFFRPNRTLSFLTAWAGIGVALVLSWILAFNVFGAYLSGDLAAHGGEETAGTAVVADESHSESEEAAAHGEEEAHASGTGAIAISSSIAWIPIGDFYAGEWFNLGVAVDPLTAVMLIMVPFAIFMIFIYSVGYHNFGQPRGAQLGTPNHGKEEPMFSRFFGMMALFATGMLALVVADNLLLLFIGWEVMGFCSYSLIGFWYARNYDDPKRTPPREASIKAFMTTRIADVVMLMGIVFFYRTFGTLNFSTALTAESIDAAINASSFGAVGLGIMALMLFTGTVGKSAQFPFHVWLPDAMEGPTPVSAVIHAAAMVSAGIYLLLRIFPLIAVGIAASPAISMTIAGIGAFTALMAATIAVAQNDVKGVLAYSTISQLGFMVAAIGIGGYIAAAFHLITHAFFKALLFLGSGSVIHGMEHGAEHVHDHHTDPQNMMFMGGLKDKMPYTFWAFVAGGMALSGFPLITAGFWSKDEIFAESWFIWTKDGNPIGLFVFAMLVVAAFLTAFYTTRQICLTFLGKPRTPLAEHAHESNGFMTFPLVMLTAFAIGFGWFGIPDNFLGTEGIFYNYFHHFVGETLHTPIADLYAMDLVLHEIETLPFNIVPVIASVVVALGGIGLGWWMYGSKPLEKGQEDPLIGYTGKALHTFLENKWYWDELYNRVFVQPTIFFSEVIVYEYIDRGFIDGTLHLVARIFYAIGQVMLRIENAVFGDGIDWLKDRFLDIAKEVRSFQSGKVQEYALTSMILAWMFAVFILLLPYLRNLLG